uniref:PXA domain-containing protein n=1 Tax=Lepeophtheirus salmonis TaxID=72036 RepID=A0A0K2UMB6_LEPSM
MDIIRDKIINKIDESTLVKHIQLISGSFIVASLFLDFLISGKFINQYIYLFIFIAIAYNSARLTDRLIPNLGSIKLSVLRNEIRLLGFPTQIWESIKKPSFLKVEYEERAVIEAWVKEITEHYILNWYSTSTDEPSKFVAEVEEELRIIFKGILLNLQSRNWDNFLIKLSNLFILHLKRKKSKFSKPVYRHPILMRTLSEHDYYVSAISAVLNKFGNRTKYTKYANTNDCSLHHLIIIEILSKQLVTRISNISSTSNKKKNESPNVKKLVNEEIDGAKKSEIKKVPSSEKFNIDENNLENTHIKIIEGSHKKRPSINLPNILNKSVNNDKETSKTYSTPEPSGNPNAEIRTDDEQTQVIDLSDEEVQNDNLESEDMDTAIIKLRQLLEEKENSYEQGKHKSLTIPSDGRMFFNINLSEEGFDSYVIIYDAVIINKTSSNVPSSNQFEYTTKTIQTTRSYNEFVNLEKDLRKKYNLEFQLEIENLALNQNKLDILKSWLDKLIHHYESSTSSEVKHFLKYPTDEIDLQLGKADKGQRIDKFLAKTVSGVFASIKDRLPNFEDDNSVHEEDIEHMDTSNEGLESGILSDLSIKERLENGHMDKDDNSLHLPVRLNFSPMANELSEFEINLNCAVHEEMRSNKEECKKVNGNEVIVFQRGDNYKKFIEKEMFKDELTESLTEKLIHLSILLFVDEMKGKYAWLKSQFMINIAKVVLSHTVDELIEDVLASWTNENAWKAIFMQLRQILWYEKFDVSSSCFEEQCTSQSFKRIVKNVFASKEANRELIYNITDLILSTVLNEENK